MFAGISFHRANPGSALGVELIAALSPRRKADAEGIWLQGPFLLAQTSTLDATKSSLEEVPCRCPESGLVIASWARIDNRNELLCILELPKNSTDAQLILAAYRHWGENCVLHLIGDFSFAIADPATETLFLARDPLGVRPLYYWTNQRFFAFATSPAVFSHLEIKPEPDPDWVASYLFAVSAGFTATAYKDVSKLPPGHSMTIFAGKEKLRRYFSFKDDSPVSSKRSDLWIEEYRSKLAEAVRCRLRGDHPIGCESSGGLDSATVVSFAAKHSSRLSNIHCFGVAQCELDTDYILETGRFCGISNNHIITSIDEVSDEVLERYLEIAGYPPERRISTFHEPIYDQCEQFGIRTLFSGYGGDEIVTQQGQHLSLELLLNRQYKALWENLPGNPLTRALRYGKTAKNLLFPPAFNRNWYSAYSERQRLFILRSDIIENLDLREKHLAEARYDAPYRRINDFILQRLISPVMTERLENCSLMAKSYGIDYSWPLLDVRLIQQYLSTPAIEKASCKWNRFLHRRAIEGVVSPQVQWKLSKDMGDLRQIGAAQAKLIRIAEEDAVDLHPVLAELVDRKKFCDQIQLALKNKLNDKSYSPFRANVIKVRWLNYWLKRT